MLNQFIPESNKPIFVGNNQALYFSQNDFVNNLEKFRAIALVDLTRYFLYNHLCQLTQLLEKTNEQAHHRRLTAIS